MENKNFINDYFNKIIIYSFLFLLDFFIYLTIKYFPKNVLRSNETKSYVRYIIDCKHQKRYKYILYINLYKFINIFFELNLK